MGRHISARKSRCEIYAALLHLPPGLSRMIAEYGISASELIEEYARHISSRLTLSWTRTVVQITMKWSASQEHYAVGIRLGCNDRLFDNRPGTDDFVGMVEKYFEGCGSAECVTKTIRQILDDTMKINAVRLWPLVPDIY